MTDPAAGSLAGGGDRRAAREAARRAKDRRGFVIALVSSVVVLGGLALLVTGSSGWPEFRDLFLSADAFRTTFPDILSAFWLDIRMFLVVEAIVLVLGLVIALIRINRSPALFPIRALAVVYTDVFRGVPVILMVYLIGYGFPALELKGLPTDPIVLAGIALSLCYSSYVAEVYRAGIESVHGSQMDSALAMGLTRVQAMRHVIVPQAVRRVRPPLLNDFISLQKDVALVSILGIVEAFRQAQIFTQTDFNYTPLLGAALLYLAVTIPMARLLDYMERRERRRSA